MAKKEYRTILIKEDTHLILTNLKFKFKTLTFDNVINHLVKNQK